MGRDNNPEQTQAIELDGQTFINYSLQPTTAITPVEVREPADSQLTDFPDASAA
jgi:hypothetical protein